jgi:hypothetical protein
MANRGHPDFLVVWQVAVARVGRVYAVPRQFQQMKDVGSRHRSDGSPMRSRLTSRKAEGKFRTRSLSPIARLFADSQIEVETQLKLIRRLKFLNEVSASELGNLTGEAGRMLNIRRSSLADARRPEANYARVA